jgi:hypothetical protein
MMAMVVTKSKHTTLARTNKVEYKLILLPFYRKYRIKVYIKLTANSKETVTEILGRFHLFLQAMKALKVNRCIALLCFLNLGTRRGWGFSVTSRPLVSPGKDPVPIVQEAGWAPGPVWKSAENLAPTGIRSSDRPARSQSLYRLSYPAHKRKC